MAQQAPCEEHVLSQGYSDGSGPKWIVTVHNPPIMGESVVISDGNGMGSNVMGFSGEDWAAVVEFVDNHIVWPNPPEGGLR